MSHSRSLWGQTTGSSGQRGIRWQHLLWASEQDIAFLKGCYRRKAPLRIKPPQKSSNLRNGQRKFSLIIAFRHLDPAMPEVGPAPGFVTY